ncbi:hypothetical protein N480_21530 [Pseudoalteromonas luteoviolacea S2607]|uniref:AraC family transcriptional regulator n=1 Tax=Pseudoalteromonas luteoviolacea TaxID=43657 RepID=UPI0007B0BD6D|nr:AraC family transcriptional regulator ligand-binding domain-containing protein [Pseudoalteromonas luteoviolacea]KZN34610.1 hypothetical protein N480_21530 [Pseudoalteromonas luteoviolacea S2607]
MPYIEIGHEALSTNQLLLPLIELVKQRGVHPDKALKGTKLFYDDLKKQGHRSSFKQLVQVLQNMTHYHLGQDLSFVLGQHMLHNISAQYAPYLFHCANLKSVLVTCNQLQNCIFPYFNARIFRKKQTLHFVLNPAISQIQPFANQFLLEVWLSMVCGFLKWRLPDTTISFQLPFPEPEYAEQFRAFCHQPLTFSQHFAGFVVHHSMMNTQQHAAIEALKAPFCQLQSLPRAGFLSHIESYLIAHPKASQDDLANYLSISTATLKRKFALHNCQFGCVKDRLLSQKAVFCIQQQGYSNAQVAKLLHFNDLPNFRRTFKRWLGITPSELRKV